MKRYALFQGDEYYAKGGWRDFVGTYDSIEEATSVAKENAAVPYKFFQEWSHVVDLQTGRVHEL